MRYFAVCAVIAVSACTVTYDRFLYEVTQSSHEEVRIQTHKGALNMEADQVTKMFAHMDGLASKECSAFGKTTAIYKGKRTYTTGAYYAWLERIYACK